MNKNDIPLYEYTDNISSGGWFKKSKAHGQILDGAGQITYTKGLLNKRTEKANEVIKEE